MKKNQFRKSAERIIRNANPDTALTLKWTFGPTAVTWNDGTKGHSGVVSLTADGYRSREMHASYLTGTGITVR